MFEAFSQRRMLVAVSLVIGASLVWMGCDNTPKARDLPLDQSLAKQSLTTALDAWKAGGKPADLKDKQPSIIAGDSTWASGAKLLDYKVTGEHELGNNLQVEVELSLEQGTEKASYLISTSPAITVFREGE